MKRLGIFCLAAALVAAFVATASADEPATAIAPSSLASMGLGGMRAMSDDEGTAVRGMGVFVGSHFSMNSFDHQKFDRRGFDHKKMDGFVHKKGFDHGFDHKKSFGHSFSHNSFGHKSFGHGGSMIWQPRQMVWQVGGKSSLW